MQKSYILDRIFKLEANGTTIKREFLAGLTTFFTMAYVIFVHPTILADAGIPKEAAFVATIYVTVISTIFMALWANLPLAVAPAMGLNVFFSYYVCGALGLHWTVALGASFISGIIFVLLTVTNVRRLIIDAVPMNLKQAIIVGIGLFITMIGFQSSGILIDNPATLIALGDLKQPKVYLACFGLLISGVLLARQVQGALLYGILITTLLSMCLGITPIPTSIDQVMSFSIPSITPVLWKLDLMGAIEFGIISIIFTFTVIELFNNIGSLIALLSKADLMDQNGKIKGMNKALFVDSIGVMISAGFGSSAVIAYVENAAGIAAGGRTGLTAIVVALLFLLMLVFAPLIQLIPSFATAPALIIVGLFMTKDIAHINFDDFTEGLPAFLLLIIMPLSYSIGNGFIFGFISYAMLKLCTGRAKEVNLIMWVVVGFFIINILVS